MYAFLCALARFFSYLSRPQALHLGSTFAGLLYGVYRLTPWRRLLQGHIHQSFPSLSKKEQDRIARQHVKTFLWAIVDFLRFWQWRQRHEGAVDLRSHQLPRHVLLVGDNHYQAAYGRGKGVILVSAHFGCWEYIPALSALQGHPTTVLVQKPAEPYFERLFTTFRGFAGVNTVNNDSYKGMGTLLRALRRQEVVGLVIDQHGESEQLIGSLMGKTVSLPAGPGALARRTGAAVVPVFARWWGNQQIIEYLPARFYEQQDTDLSFTQALYDDIEKMIRKYPENWLWSYNRWDKYTPS